MTKELAINDAIERLRPGGKLVEVTSTEYDNIYWLKFRLADNTYIGIMAEIGDARESDSNGDVIK